MRERLYPHQIDPTPRTGHDIFPDTNVVETPYPAELDVYPKSAEQSVVVATESNTPQPDQTETQTTGSTDQPPKEKGRRYASSDEKTIGNPDDAFTVIGNSDQPAAKKGYRRASSDEKTIGNPDDAFTVIGKKNETTSTPDESPVIFVPAEDVNKNSNKTTHDPDANKVNENKPQSGEPEQVDADAANAAAAVEAKAKQNAEETDLRKAFTKLFETLTPEETKLFHADLQKLYSAHDNYTTLAAKRERLTITPKLTEKKVEAARAEYEQLRFSMKTFVGEKLIQAGLSKREARLISVLDDTAEVGIVGLAIKNKVEEFSELSGPLAKQRRSFYDKWASWGGGGKTKFFSKGNFKKAGVMGGVGFVVGAPAALVGVALLGPIMGGAAATMVARGVARGLVRSHLDKKSEQTVATKQMDRRVQDAKSGLDTFDSNFPKSVISDEKSGIDIPDKYKPEEYGPPKEITGAFAAGTKRAVERNRQRAAKSAVIGALGGLAGYGVFSNLPGIDFPGGETASATPKGGPTGTETSETTTSGGKGVSEGRLEEIHEQPIVGGAPKTIPGGELNVQAGSGIIQEINEYASAHGHDISGADATRIYEDLKAEHGTRFIDVAGADTYAQGNDIRITHPGAGNWYPGVEDDLDKELAKLR